MSDSLKKSPNREQDRPAENGEIDRNKSTDATDTGELELVSTVMLNKLLDSDDVAAQSKLRDVASQKDTPDGILAHNSANDSYEIVAPGDDIPLDNDIPLELVSTQMLKDMKIIVDDDVVKDELPPVDKGFDPYNSD